jgi:hypothetical protein
MTKQNERLVHVLNILTKVGYLEHTSRLGTLTLLEIQLLLVDTQYCADFEDTMTKAVFVEV